MNHIFCLFTTLQGLLDCIRIWVFMHSYALHSYPLDKIAKKTYVRF